MMFADQTELLPSWTLMLMAANSFTRWRKMKGTSNSWMVSASLQMTQTGLELSELMLLPAVILGLRKLPHLVQILQRLLSLPCRSLSCRR